MKDWHLLIWVTQLGLSTAAPLAGFVLLGVWLYRRFQWGPWVIVAGILLGLICAIDGLKISWKAMERMTKDKTREPIKGFNEHE